ncbi:hypothetical protein L6164_001538 [Bauhinia variegata]|uniref:Uncharacterized protein n=1 Tax=Bauhinia variegata TaxID=167791 RepID=A0ACB9QAF0_BAUVA|nr:hypothetical protein L6164_001538 [Bauhinia variegata]
MEEQWSKKQSYFFELLNRNLILAIIETVDGRVKSFRILDFLRETILSKSREENFVQALTKENAAKLPEGARRLSILHLPHQVDMSQLWSSLLSKLRSLFWFEKGTSVTVSNCSSIVSKLLSGGLKVLDLEGAPLDTCPEQISNLFLLRYLSFRKTQVPRLNIPIGNLHSLVTLDLRQSYITVLPSEIYKLHKLRHLLICQYEDVVQGHSETREKLRLLHNTETMCSIKIVEEEEGDLISELGRLVQLRRLCLMNLRGQHGSSLCSSISKMQHLSSLTLHASETIDLQRLSSPPQLLKRLYLTGQLVKLPSWVSSLCYLEVLHLINSQLTEDPLKSLYSLPSLIGLTLCDSFTGDLMIIPPGGFARLKYLLLRQPHETKLVVDRIAMPPLELSLF